MYCARCYDGMLKRVEWNIFHHSQPVDGLTTINVAVTKTGLLAKASHRICRYAHFGPYTHTYDARSPYEEWLISPTIIKCPDSVAVGGGRKRLLSPIQQFLFIHLCSGVVGAQWVSLRHQTAHCSNVPICSSLYDSVLMCVGDTKPALLFISF